MRTFVKNQSERILPLCFMISYILFHLWRESARLYYKGQLNVSNLHKRPLLYGSRGGYHSPRYRCATAHSFLSPRACRLFFQTSALHWTTNRLFRILYMLTVRKYSNYCPKILLIVLNGNFPEGNAGCFLEESQLQQSCATQSARKILFIYFQAPKFYKTILHEKRAVNIKRNIEGELVK